MDSRLSYCSICATYTDQHIDEYIVSYMPNEICNPEFGRYCERKKYAWCCDECNNFLEDLPKQLYDF